MDWLEQLTSRFSSFASDVSNFFSNVWIILGYVLEIIQTLWFGLTSLLSSLWDLIVEIASGSVFLNVSSQFVNLGNYIGGPAVVFISTLMVIIMLRIFIAFIFRILRLNLDYRTFKTEWKTNSEEQHRKEFQKEHNIF